MLTGCACTVDAAGDGAALCACCKGLAAGGDEDLHPASMHSASEPAPRIATVQALSCFEEGFLTVNERYDTEVAAAMVRL